MNAFLTKLLVLLFIPPTNVLTNYWQVDSHGHAEYLYVRPMMGLPSRCDACYWLDMPNRGPIGQVITVTVGVEIIDHLHTLLLMHLHGIICPYNAIHTNEHCTEVM